MELAIRIVVRGRHLWQTKAEALLESGLSRSIVHNGPPSFFF